MPHLIALHLFHDQNVDVAIFEAGVGGHNDATSLLNGEFSVITNIGLDHKKQLGDSLAAIAADKAGIASQNAHLILGPDISQSLRGVIEADVRNRDVVIDQASYQGLSASWSGLDHPTRIEMLADDGQTLEYELPLLGRYQVGNFATVVALIRVLAEKGVVSDLECLKGIAKTRWHGRLEVRNGSPRYLIDAAHNKHGMLALRDSLADLVPYTKRLLVFGASSEKDYKAYLPHLCEIAPEIYLVEGFYRAEPARILAEAMPENCNWLRIFPSPGAVAEFLETSPLHKDKVVVAAGSIFMIGELMNSLDARDLQEALLSIPKSGKGIGLHRMVALCSSLAATSWMKELDAIKVTGSNGKGSVSVMIARVLSELGISTGLYTSPHLFEFNERIVINDEPISNSDLAAAFEWFCRQRDDYQQRFPTDTVGAFEAFTAMALYHFSNKKPRTIVSEAGIGGRFDSTRIIPGRLVGLTSLDLEHTDLLGNTLELIAYDKADLCPDGGVIVTGVSDSSILRRLRAYCDLRSVTLQPTSEHSEVRKVSFGESHMELDLEFDGLRLDGLQVSLQGVHQVTNVVVAILLVQEWLKRHEPSLLGEQFENALRQGMKSLHWPGRFERIQQNPDFYIDVGHSPDAIKSLVKTVGMALKGKRIVLVTGVSYDKDVEGILKELLPIAAAVICTRAYHKGSVVEDILRIVRKTVTDIPTFAEPTIEEAVAHAVDYAREHNMTVLVGGGLFLSMEAAQALRGKNPQDLHFF